MNRLKRIMVAGLSILAILAIGGCGEQAADTGENAPKAAATAGESNGTAEAAAAGNKHILVAYFSATDTTRQLAGYVAEGLEADLYEIAPVEPYTAADLDYHNDGSRSTVEMKNPDSRPAISTSVANMEQYDTVLIGYPIWWGEAPRIVDTFVETYDFSGKTVIPFCTSLGSGLGSSGDKLEALAGSGSWVQGRGFGTNTSRADAIAWAQGLNIR